MISNKSSIVCVLMLGLNAINIHRRDEKGTPRLYAVLKVINGEPVITEVEHREKKYSFYLTQEDSHVIWDSWNELQEQRSDLLELRGMTEYRGDSRDGSVGMD